ncbi:DUF302 domain-containing protein [Roseobacter sp. YSTF-M11]|uniref:DUF302 domain-containing protein n=1 Tax=Roseobacter insulae TaxID=2859783 RepID=A0A9X1JZH9_9RHOB|nr:DUF302 domain-containing protein [Roseobacter insulae]MBW4709396.1 DUF302 domain-containing protein [Roseobacter insulae]
MPRLIAAVLAALLATASHAQSIAPREGWVVIATEKTHADLLGDLKKAIKAHKMGVVTQAGPTGAARNRGITIPENRVVGVFNNDFAVKVLATSTAAMIEAPIRFYVTEETDGTATLSYKTPGYVFAPYYGEGGETLETLAGQLDERFSAIATAATE